MIELIVANLWLIPAAPLAAGLRDPEFRPGSGQARAQQLWQGESPTRHRLISAKGEHN